MILHNELLKLSKKKRKKVLRKISRENKKRIFDKIYTMTEELGLDKVPDYKTRVKMRHDLIQKFPDTVFWDYAEYQEYRKDELITFNDILVSTNGDIIKFGTDGRLIIIPAKVEKIASRYVAVRLGKKNRRAHRAVASTFIPRSDKHHNTPFRNLEVNHKDFNGQNNKWNNLEWVTNQENVLHAKGDKDYKERFYYLFEVIADNKFKGRKFILSYNEIHKLGMENKRIRKRRNNNFKGMNFTKLRECEVDQSILGLPKDIEIGLKENGNTFINNRLFYTGEVLIGKYKGYKFVIDSTKELEKYFHIFHTKETAENRRTHHKGCSFKFSDYKEAVKISNKMTDEIFNDIIANMEILKRQFKPIVGTILRGPYKGVKFSLLSKKDIVKYFNSGNVYKVINGMSKTAFGCTFEHCTEKEAKELYGNLTDKIYKTLITN